MKTILYAAMLSASLIGVAAHAEGVSRDQVRTELAAARAAGELNYGNDFPPPGISTQRGLTRDQVRAETVAAKANGGIVYDRELPAGPVFAKRDDSRAPVQAQADGKQFRRTSRSDTLDQYPA